MGRLSKLHESSEVLDALPSDKELDDAVMRTLQLSDMHFFLNVPDVRVSSASADATRVVERNEAYVEVC